MANEKGKESTLGSFLMKHYDSKRHIMARAPKPPSDRDPDLPKEMEERDPTDQEILTAAAMAGALNNPPPLPTPVPISSGTDDDDADDLPRSRTSPLPHDRTELAELQAKFDEMKGRLEQQLQASSSTDSNAMLASAIGLLAQGLQGMQTASLQGANTIAEMQRRTHLPENRTFPGISDFNPRGDKDFPRPALKCEMYIPWPVEDGSGLTREEIELLNLLEPGEYTIRTTDNSRIVLTVTVQTKLDSPEPVRLLINHDTAFNNFHHRQMPHTWLRQMAEGKPALRERARAVLTMDDERLLIELKQFNDGRIALADEHVVSIGE